MRMSSVGISSPWRIERTAASSNSGRLREGMISELAGRLAGIEEAAIGKMKVSVMA
jgi:hypothetical protein